MAQLDHGITPNNASSGTPEYLRRERIARDSYAQDRTFRYTDYQTTAEWFTLTQCLPSLSGVTLDAGCGNGRFLPRLAADSRLAVGIELSGESLRTIRCSPHAAKVRLAQAELTALPFRSGVFARVYCLGAFQSFLELRDAMLALLELGRVLEEGGTLLLTTWNYHLSDRLTGRRVRKSDHGLNFRKFAFGEFKRLLCEAFPCAEVSVWTALHFHRKPLNLGNRLFARWGAALLRMDRMLERTSASPYLGHLLCAAVRTGSRGREPIEPQTS